MPDVEEELKTGGVQVSEEQGEFLEGYTDPAGVPSPDAWRQAVADFYQLDVDASILWKQVGPAPLIVDADQNHMGTGPDAGEVTDIAIDPTVAGDQAIYVTTNDGGVWATTNGGALWRPLTDPMFSNSMGSIAIDPGNPSILYAGSGNLFDGGGTFTRSAGIYRSTDKGLSWAIVDGGYFGTLFSKVGILEIVSPMPNVLLVATNTGLYRSVDGGRNFGANGPDFNDGKPVVLGRICCLRLDSATPASTVYCGVAGDSGAATIGLLKSINGGITFPTNLFTDATAPQPPYGSFNVAQSEFDGTTANNRIMYVAVQGKLADGVTNTFLGLWRSADSGTTWNARPNLTNVAAGDGFTQTTYDLTLGVDPLDSNRVYAGFQELWLSIDGGQNFLTTSVTQGKVHWDNHVMVFSPAANRPAAPASPPYPPTAIYTGTDGGIAKSTNGGSNWTAINGKMATNLLQGIGIGRGFTDTGKGVPNSYTYGGMQDTGTAGSRPADNFGEWHAAINGDGWLIAVDPSDPTVVYGFDNQFFIKTTNAGANWDISNLPVASRKVGIGLTNGGSPRAIALDQTGTDPANRIVYVSEIKTLNKSIDSGKNFTTIFTAPDDIRCLATTGGSAGVIWIGCKDGSVHFSNDGGSTWDTGTFNAKPAGTVPIGRISSIAIDPTNIQSVAAVCDGFSGVHAKYRTRHVFLTRDGGTTWADVSGTDGGGPVGNVPDMPLWSVVFDITGSTASKPPAIIVAGDAGVLRSTDATVTVNDTVPVGTATWKIYGSGLPMVCCKSLAIDNNVAPAVLRVGTYGRSCFEASRPSGPKFVSDGNLAFGFIASGQSVTLPFYVYNSGDVALQITAVSATPPFSVPAGAVSIPPGGTQKFDVTYTETGSNNSFGLLQFDTNDASGTQFISLSGSVVNTGLTQRLAANPGANCGFGIVEMPANRSISVQLFNVGFADLNISGITRTAGSADFTLNPTPAFANPIAAGGAADFAIQFEPSGAGARNAEFTISSDDPHGPLKITATGTGTIPTSGPMADLLRMLGLTH